MAIQIGGATVISDSKYLERIGGAGGVISGSLVVPGNTVRYIRLAGTRGVAFYFGGFDLNDGSMFGYQPAFASCVAVPVLNSSSYGAVYVNTFFGSNNSNLGLSVLANSDYNTNNFGLSAVNNQSPSKTFYYFFYYTGAGTPTLSVT